MLTIEISRGFRTRIDDEDLPIFQAGNWRIFSVKRKGVVHSYVYDFERRLMLSRAIHDPGPGLMVDHADGDTLNNTRANLRVCNHAQNGWNRKATRGRELPKGVSLTRNGLFSAEVKANGVRHRKCFSSLAEAFAWRQETARSLHGEFYRVA